MATCNGKDLVAHIERYENKIHSSFFEDWTLQDFPFVLLMPDGSFCTYGIIPGALRVGPTCGDCKVFKPILVNIAKMISIHRIITATKRNPEAYAKVTGATLYRTDIVDGTPSIYNFELEVD